MSSTTGPDSQPLPDYLHGIARRARFGTERLGRPLAPTPRAWTPRRSAVLLLLAGMQVADAHVLVEERGHEMRSQPGQFSLPGGGVEPEDVDVIATALRESREEIGLVPSAVEVLGAFAPIAMPWRSNEVYPVLAWAPQVPPVRVVDPHEVASVRALPLAGDGSLTDPAVRRRGLLDGKEAGPAFDLPEGTFVWGFTAMLLEGMLQHMDLLPADADRAAAPAMEIPERRRREGALRPTETDRPAL